MSGLPMFESLILIIACPFTLLDQGSRFRVEDMGIWTIWCLEGVSYDLLGGLTEMIDYWSKK
jgi:hypothetical protein